MSLYDDLGVPDNATTDEIRSAYRRKAQKAHPDRGGDKEQFHAIVRAYTVLADPSARKRYDDSGDASDPAEALMRELTGLFLLVIDRAEIDLDRVDIAAMVRTAINEGQVNLRTQIGEVETKIKRRQKAIKRLKRKREGQNVIAAMLESDIATGRRTIEKLQREIAHGEAMLEALLDFNYLVDLDLGQDLFLFPRWMYGANGGPTA